MQLLVEGPQHITMTVQGPALSFTLSIIYASHRAGERELLWADLIRHRTEYTVLADSPWYLAGDFNCVRQANERQGGRIPRTRNMEMFNDCIFKLGLTEPQTSGETWTWTNNRRNTLMYERIDRCFTNTAAMVQHPILVITLPFYSSDHAPILILPQQRMNIPRPPFRFQNMWLRHEDFQSFVRSHWHGHLSESPMETLNYRLRNLKFHLRWWNRHVFGNIHTQVDALKHELADVNRFLQTQFADDIWERRNRVSDRLDEMVRRQELFYLQKSRAQWLKEGDRNTRFFHASITHRSHSDYTPLIEAYDQDYQRMQEAGVEYFSTLLTSQQTEIADDMLESIPSLVTTEECSLITAIPTRDEIKRTVFSMSKNRAPGPDGFPADFYISCWEIVGMDVVEAIMEVFRRKVLTRSWKATFLALIPKVNTPTTFRDFRPISLCNVCYKIVSKLVTSRLRPLLNRLISPEQCGFVKGRHIHDNIMLVNELAQSLDYDVRGSNTIITLDMEKAFERIDWNFLVEVLRRFGFTNDFITLVNACVRENHFSLLVNGSSTSFFTATRGLRQGDPLSPTLFILAEEVLSRSLTRAITQGSIKPYFSKRGCPIISHSLFADDAILSSTDVRHPSEDS